MPPKKKKKIVWNNNDCRASVCKRPPATSTWVKCDNCKGWFHIICVGLTLDNLQGDNDWFCAECLPVKTEEYEVVKARLLRRVQELADTQDEFGGLTISRELFREKKNAGVYNYSTDFPPTLRDLCCRVETKYTTLSHFKEEYLLMCKKMKVHLLPDFESRVQFIQFELDDILEEMKSQPTTEPEPTPEPEPEPCLPSFDFGRPIIKTEVCRDDSTDRHEGEDSEKQNRAAVILQSCEYCEERFTEAEGGIYSCKRSHYVCASCRLVVTGCVCPVCNSKYGDRRRLALDHAANIHFRCSSEVIQINAPSKPPEQQRGCAPRRGRPRKKISTADQGQANQQRIPSPISPDRPQISKVWSCRGEPNVESTDFQFLPVPSRLIKQEVADTTAAIHDFNQKLYPSGLQDGRDSAQEQQTPIRQPAKKAPVSIDMSSIISDDKLSQQLLTLINTNVVTEFSQSPQNGEHGGVAVQPPKPRPIKMTARKSAPTSRPLPFPTLLKQREEQQYNDIASMSRLEEIKEPALPVHEHEQLHHMDHLIPAPVQSPWNQQTLMNRLESVKQELQDHKSQNKTLLRVQDGKITVSKTQQPTTLVPIQPTTSNLIYTDPEESQRSSKQIPTIFLSPGPQQNYYSSTKPSIIKIVTEPSTISTTASNQSPTSPLNGWKEFQFKPSDMAPPDSDHHLLHAVGGGDTSTSTVIDQMFIESILPNNLSDCLPEEEQLNHAGGNNYIGHQPEQPEEEGNLLVYNSLI